MKKKVKKFIEQNSGLINFGTPDHAVSPCWIEKAEKKIGFKFTESYLWFLTNYRGGEIGGEEIFSVYGQEFEDIIGGDIVGQHISNQKGNIIKPNELVVTTTDFAEIFFFDYAKYENGECPICLKYGTGEPEHYADDFYEFLEKRIKVFLS